MELVVHDSPAAVAGAVSSSVSQEINEKASTGETTFSLGLAGGSTPESTYKNLAAISTDWQTVTAWLADERWVPHDSPRSNGLMAAQALFDHVPAKLVRPEFSEEMAPDESASGYGRFLRDLHLETPPDLVLLGLGDDGHTASLFPGSRALDETRHRYVSNVIPETGEIRLTATYPFLNTARRIVFLVVGEAKALALEASLAGKTPAGRVGGSETRVEWHVDRPAASRLS
ncbi:MAG: 6-phosphogluconolactonase [Acidimicrobiia bacterium]